MSSVETYVTCPTCGNLIKKSVLKRVDERKQIFDEFAQDFNRIKEKWRSGEITILEYCNRVNPILDIIMESFDPKKGRNPTQT